MSAFTALERFALCQPIPRLQLPALVDPTDRELLMRRVEICIWAAYDKFGSGEAGLTNMILAAGVPLEELHATSKD